MGRLTDHLKVDTEFIVLVIFITAYCSATNIPFVEEMLRWESVTEANLNGLTDDVADWCWYEMLLKTTGFVKKSRTELEKYENLEKLPTEIQECIRESMDYYMFLKSQKLEVKQEVDP